MRHLVLALVLAIVMVSYPLVAAQEVDVTGFEGTWGGFTPRGSSDESDYVSPKMVTTIAHSGTYSVEAAAGDRQQSWMGKWYGGQAAVRIPFVVAIWVYVKSQAAGNLEFAQLWGFAQESEFSGGTGYWLASLMRSADGYAMIRTSREIKSDCLVSTRAWHEYSVAYDGRSLSLVVDHTLELTDDSTGGQIAVGAINFGVTSGANSKAGTKAPDIGYGTVYYDDYSLERGMVLTQTVTQRQTFTTTQVSVTSVTLETVPGWVYWALPVVVVLSVVITYGVIRGARRGRPPKAAKPTAVSKMLCVKCGAALPLGSKFCDNCGASQKA